MVGLVLLFDDGDFDFADAAVDSELAVEKNVEQVYQAALGKTDAVAAVVVVAELVVIV